MLNSPDIETKTLVLNEPALDESQYEVADDADGFTYYRKISSGSRSVRHPTVVSYEADPNRYDPCVGSNESEAVGVQYFSNQVTDDWVVAHKRKVAVCYWASEQAYPHFIG